MNFVTLRTDFLLHNMLKKEIIGKKVRTLAGSRPRSSYSYVQWVDARFRKNVTPLLSVCFKMFTLYELPQVDYLTLLIREREV